MNTLIDYLRAIVTNFNLIEIAFKMEQYEGEKEINLAEWARKFHGEFGL